MQLIETFLFSSFMGIRKGSITHLCPFFNFNLRGRVRIPTVQIFKERCLPQINWQYSINLWTQTSMTFKPTFTDIPLNNQFPSTKMRVAKSTCGFVALINEIDIY